MTGVSVSSGASVSSGIGADHTGEYVQFWDQPGFHLLTAQNTFTPRYWGPRISSKSCTVRPATTKKIVITDDVGALDDSTVQVYSWAYPPPLYQEFQRPLIPHYRALELLMWIDLIGPIGKRHREAAEYRNELWGDANTEGAMSIALARNPKNATAAMARNRQGGMMKLGRNR